MAFGLQYAMPEASLPDTWRAVIAEQAGLLETMLYSVQSAVEAARQRTDRATRDMTKRLENIVSETRQQLAHLAHQSMIVEQQIGRFMAQMQQAEPYSADMVERMQLIEQVNAILHANIILSQRLLDHMMPEIEGSP